MARIRTIFLRVSRGAFSIYTEGEQFVINAHQGETKTFSRDRVPVGEIADCLSWMSENELTAMRQAIGDSRFKRAKAFARKWDWID